jgi:hypothetical protein
MASIMNCTPILVLLLACVKFASADAYYIGPTVGGVIGLVSEKKYFFCSFKINNIFLGFFSSRLSSFWILLLLLKFFVQPKESGKNFFGFY